MVVVGAGSPRPGRGDPAPTVSAATTFTQNGEEPDCIEEKSAGSIEQAMLAILVGLLMVVALFYLLQMS